MGKYEQKFVNILHCQNFENFVPYALYKQICMYVAI